MSDTLLPGSRRCSPLALLALVTLSGNWASAHIPITPDFTGATYYKRTITTGQGGTTYTYTALGNTNPKAGEVLVIIWDFTASPCPDDAVRVGIARMDYTGPVVTGSCEGMTLPQPFRSQYPNETKKIRVEFTPTASGTYTLSFRQGLRTIKP